MPISLPPPESLWPVVKSPGISSTPDPLARREAVLLVKDAGSAADTPWLLERMDDPDADVQIAAAEALGAVGDRRALLRLKRVQSRAGFMGRDLAMAATDARNAIEVRYPLPTIERVVLCEANPLQHSSVSESTLFLTVTGAVYGVVTIDHVQVGAQITVRWRDGDTVLREEQHTLTDEPSDQRVAEIQETVIVAPAGEQAPLTGRRPARRAPLGRGEPDGPRPNPFRRSSPFGQDDSDDDDDLPDLPRRRSPFERDEPAPARPSFSVTACRLLRLRLNLRHVRARLENVLVRAKHRMARPGLYSHPDHHLLGGVTQTLPIPRRATVRGAWLIRMKMWSQPPSLNSLRPAVQTTRRRREFAHARRSEAALEVIRQRAAHPRPAHPARPICRPGCALSTIKTTKGRVRVSSGSLPRRPDRANNVRL